MDDHFSPNYRQHMSEGSMEIMEAPLPPPGFETERDACLDTEDLLEGPGIMPASNRFTSPAWEHFTREKYIVDGVEKQKATCKYCSHVLSAGKGTRHLNTHADKCPLRPKNTGGPGPILEQVPQSSSPAKEGALQHLMNISKKIRVSKSRSGSISESEFQDYLMQGLEEDHNLDVLSWWKSQEHKFPILSKMARDILAVPASTVASEASFSASGRVVNEYRTRLKPELIEALVLLKDWDRAEKRTQDADVIQMQREDIELVLHHASTPDYVDV